MKQLIFLISILGITSCAPQQKKQGVDYNSMVMAPATYRPQEISAYIHSQCYTCHSFTAPEKEGRVAPPLVAVKAHYLQAFPKRDEFINGLSQFVMHPSTQTSQMKGAISRFGLMPIQTYQDSMIARVAAYMYDYKIEEPSWFAAHWQNMNGESWKQIGITPPAVTSSDQNPGLSIALKAKQELGKNLMGQLQKNGVEAALEFCKLKAMPITNSLSKVYHATIKRITDKPRNPLNKAGNVELTYLQQFVSELAANKQSEGVTLKDSMYTQFYYPITTNNQCLQCHGSQKDILPEIKKLIDKLYPTDLAKGYGADQLRGMWSIKFSNKNE